MQDVLEIKDKEIERLKNIIDNREDELLQLKSSLKDYEKCNERLRKLASIGDDGVDWQLLHKQLKELHYRDYQMYREECAEWKEAYDSLKEKYNELLEMHHKDNQ